MNRPCVTLFGMTAPTTACLLTIRFLAELSLLAALGYAGWRIGEPALASAVLLVVLPVTAATAWGLWVAPRAGRRLPDPSRLAVELTLFALAFAALLLDGPEPVAAVAGVILWAAYLFSVPVRRSHGRSTDTGPMLGDRDLQTRG